MIQFEVDFQTLKWISNSLDITRYIHINNKHYAIYYSFLMYISFLQKTTPFRVYDEYKIWQNRSKKENKGFERFFVAIEKRIVKIQISTWFHVGTS